MAKTQQSCFLALGDRKANSVHKFLSVCPSGGGVSRDKFHLSLRGYFPQSVHEEEDALGRRRMRIDFMDFRAYGQRVKEGRRGTTKGTTVKLLKVMRLGTFISVSALLERQTSLWVDGEEEEPY